VFDHRTGVRASNAACVLLAGYTCVSYLGDFNVLNGHTGQVADRYLPIIATPPRRIRDYLTQLNEAVAQFWLNPEAMSGFSELKALHTRIHNSYIRPGKQ
jgi:hypothetical protein